MVKLLRRNKTNPMLKGTYVSRSVYQKLKEENKKLLSDLRTISMEPGIEAVKIRIKWCKHFKHEDDLNNAIRTVLRQYAKEHPEMIGKRD